MPSADFCHAITGSREPASPDARHAADPPEVSSTAFAAPPAESTAQVFDGMDFAVSSPLVRPDQPRYPFLSIGSRFCSTLPSDPASRRRTLRFANPSLHQAG